ncbi:hypothetical protein AB0F15_41770 [Amycolatopsis sp. NPDC026612]|uniref:hypothetical protein n=1 Tax=Amycolatopsis sp. NPDC026612 TaxID=3155466 RepID=UPI003407B289
MTPALAVAEILGDYLWHMKNTWSPLGSTSMNAHVSADVRALFSDMGIEFDKTATDLVIEQFGQWREASSGGPARACYCRADVLEAA